MHTVGHVVAGIYITVDFIKQSILWCIGGIQNVNNPAGWINSMLSVSLLLYLINLSSFVETVNFFKTKLLFAVCKLLSFFQILHHFYPPKIEYLMSSFKASLALQTSFCACVISIYKVQRFINNSCLSAVDE